MLQWFRFACAFVRGVGSKHFFEKLTQRLVQILVAIAYGLVSFPGIAFKYE